MRRRSKRGLKGIPPLEDHVKLAEQVNPWWLRIAAAAGIILIGGALWLDLVAGIENIVPSVCLELGAGMLLFSLIFYLERRIVRRTSLVFVSAFEEMATRMGRDTGELQEHFAGPVAVVEEFVDAMLTHGDYSGAWRRADSNWRLCRAQAWLWNNRAFPEIAALDLDDAAAALARVDSDHPLWPAFADIELEQFTQAWADRDLSNMAPRAPGEWLKTRKSFCWSTSRNTPTAQWLKNPHR